MSQCLKPDCLHINLENAEFCCKCGSKLILVGRYRAISILGQGGFGRTFLAIDEFKPSKPRCVVKQFLPDVKGKKALKKAAELFEREAMRLDELGKHEQIPELLAFFSQEDRQYLIQEFIDGIDLAKELKIRGVFNAQQIRELLNNLLPILQFVHQHNIIHRDIKPENIIRRKKDGKLVLVDFGAAKEISDSTNSSLVGTIIGSVAYIAPEQAIGKAKFASDLYSLGATCLHLLTNIQPTELFDIAEGEWIWRDYLQNNEIDYELSHVIDKLIEPATKKRFQSVTEVFQALNKDIFPTISSKLPTNYPNHQPNQQISTHHPVNSRKIRTTNQISKKSPPKSPLKLNLKILQFEFATITSNPSLIIGKPPMVSTEYHRGKAKYITVDLGKGVSIDLIGIPGGKFLMGSPETELERGDDESPQHLVSIRPFLMSKYPITQSQWQEIMGNNPSKFINNNLSNSNKPVERVSWFDCISFCQKLSKLVSREFRLPTEAEWEYACRGRTTTPFHFGNTITTQLANYNGEYVYGASNSGEYRHQTTDVDSFSPNQFGLYDLHGNVAEWCADSWHDNYHHAPQDGSAWTNNHQKAHVLRGGSWLHLPSSCRSAQRLNASPSTKSDAFGFRIASSV